MAGSKFSRVVKFKSGYHVISHQGTQYTEDEKGTGYFEAPHAHANEFNAAGFTEDYADDLDTAKRRRADEQRAAQQNQQQPIKK